jgi:mono/diheme cytochrome c family protein
MKKRLLGGMVGLIALGLLAGGRGTANAGLELQKKAKEAGFPAQNCLYCHGEKLPKKGAVTQNERGQWLTAEKEKRKAKAIDVTWLKDYVEPKK